MMKIGKGLLEKELPQFCKQLEGTKILIADEALKELYADDVAKRVDAQLITIPGGEKSKTLETAQFLLEELSKLAAERTTTLLALGGGATTDLVAFVASIYMRGLPLILLPTTLLAMVDAAIGGKTAVDTSFGKNLIGSFYEPIAIFADLGTLESLSEKERKNGMSEIYKMGLIYDAALFDDPKQIERAINCKMEIVASDRNDQGLRHILNFGHTIGHALEAASEYEIAHGEAVAMGCLAESHLSMCLGYLSEKDFEKIQSRFGPIKLPPGYTRTKLLQALQHDKKRKAGQIRFVLIDKIGHALPFDGAYCRAVTLDELEPTLNWMENHPIRIPGSKSYTNRALILAALTKGPVHLKAPLYSDDTEAMIDCLRSLGLKVETKPDEIIVYDDISCIKEQTHHLFARDSGTTYRFMLALLCIVPGTKILKGSRRLIERPIQELIDALRHLGAHIEPHEEGLKIGSRCLLGSSVTLKGDRSSQFCSALLMIAPLLPEGLTIYHATPQISKPYIDMTIHCMRRWGITIEEKVHYHINPQSYHCQEYLIEGDYSSAAYFFAIAAIRKIQLTIANLNPNSLQADRKFLSLLEKMGNEIIYGENQVTVQGKGLKPLEIDMEDCPDQVMTIAVLGAFANGTTTITGIRSLRLKESERVIALKNELSKMGIQTDETENSLTIYGGAPKAAVIDTYNDHRIAMSFAVAKMHLSDIDIRHQEVVKKTFPTFWETLGSIK
jgi:3-phosphoshikimate 1-carboxyvinyltransferase/3-dehydroquinate synthase